MPSERSFFMKCPECACEESKVIDSRPTENKVRRRRECIQCGARFTTYEIIEDAVATRIPRKRLPASPIRIFEGSALNQR